MESCGKNALHFFEQIFNFQFTFMPLGGINVLTRYGKKIYNKKKVIERKF